MTRAAPPRLASWLLRCFAFGPERESLIGDIAEQYEQGRSRAWYLRQTLATVFIGSAIRLRTHPRTVLRACVFAITVPVFSAVAGWSLMLDIRGHDWLTVVSALGAFGYCSMGVIVLMLTIVDEPVSLSLVEPTRG